MYTSGISGFRTAASAGSLTAAAVLADDFIAQEKMEVKQIAFVISTATVSSGNIVITVKKRITVDSATGEVTIGTLSIPTAVAAGAVYYKDVTPVKVDQGEQVVFEVTTAAAGGGAAGAGYALLQADQSPEEPADNADMVASA